MATVKTPMPVVIYEFCLKYHLTPQQFRSMPAEDVLLLMSVGSVFNEYEYRKMKEEQIKTRHGA